MIDISVQNVKKAFVEGVDILDGISFDINENERVGLLGKNGAGKTTLLRLLTGELESDEGVIVMPESKRIGLISQIPEYPNSYSAEDVIRTAFNQLKAIASEMMLLEERMQTDESSATLKAYDKLAFEYERLGGYDTEFELNRVANGLRIPSEQRLQPFNSLSGGEKTRINLARLILEDTDILLLDEPTNHLDMRATEWLEETLDRFKGTVLIVSHDRYFLDKTVNRTIEISKGKAEFYSGNYSFYVVEKKRRYEEQLLKYEREQEEAKRLREAAQRLHQWGTGNEKLMQKSRSVLKRAERAVTTERPDRDKSVRAKFNQKEFRGDEVIVVRELLKSYGNRKLIDIEELEVHGGERIALIGDNGTGKTTFARMIIGEEKQDEGVIRRGPSVKTAYLPQIVSFDYPRRSLLDTLIFEQNLSPQTARNRLGAFMFSGEDVFKLVGTLSGGEKSRLRLCMLMNSDINLLVLDEPTNHLDLSSREWIEDALENYEQTLIFISHDRYFVNKFATRIWELEDGVFNDFLGSFTQYRAQKSDKALTINTKKEQMSGQKPKAKQKIKPADAQKELRRLEREIDKLENEINELQEQKEEYSSDYEKLLELEEKEQKLQSELDDVYSKWELLAREL